MNQEQQLADYLRTPAAIRERCGILLQLACDNRLPHFQCNLNQLDTVTDYVYQVTQKNYPDFNIPFHSRWRHFEVGTVSRITELDQLTASLSPLDKAKAKIELAITSVLLDAGAGSQWRYSEPETGQLFQQSEGLAVASFRLFCQGRLSSEPEFPLQADARGLQQLTVETLADSFQVTPDNPLIGLTGRVELLQRLGDILPHKPQYFGSSSPRLGNLVDYWLKVAEHPENGSPRLSAATILQTILTELGDIWASRHRLAGVNLGDVWQHSALSAFPPPEFPQLETELCRYVPFHKLSQWLTYSLLEPLTELGVEIVGLEELTGLAEYRNGGLCLDLGLLELKNIELYFTPHLPGSEVIVEWRALTLILLDKIAARLREKLQRTPQDLPLVQVLQGGTWAAGRQIAQQKRQSGTPPLELKSDGTVF
ncbi:URC4/urg3 family protein [Spirulina sp. CS-785/01]|uniref:URC4/urg3 family protein n=1 Tax=Spirulina sp. CS-785/01 TaxID=3021716 RepID=UPI00232F8621|nr:URC4/urg3 family protein [Spirulina sp. CS-785/01]MDB9312081.1 URC4/urg3 family protein [Spirulina sp. CS-785/01]